MAVFNGTAGDDNLAGGAENDVLNGLAGNDTLNGGAGADTMSGNTGNDLYFVDNIGDVVSESAGEGTDTVSSSINFTLGANFENLTGTGSAGLTLTGNGLANLITGSTGADRISGGDDNLVDTLVGGQGNDTYVISNTGATVITANDVITEGLDNALNSSGIDTVLVVASAARNSYTLNNGAGVENITASDASSTLRLDLTGNDFAQNISGNAGVNVLVGGGGADTLTGFGGNDTYNIGSVDAVVIEGANGGNDTVNISANNGAATAVSYTFSGDIETISASGASGAINITGGDSNQSITGNADANLLNGGGGIDTLNGGQGNDTYVVDRLEDVIVDAGGDDQVNAASSYQLNVAGIEVFAATGTSLPGTLGAGTGQGDGTLSLAGLNTTTNPNGGTTFYTGDTATTQTIYGNAGNNILNGRTGTGAGGLVDTLVGGTGDDIYRVYEQGDVVVEDTTGGNDTIYTSSSYSLAANDTAAQAAAIGANTGANYLAAGASSQIENLIVADATSTTDIDLTGNGYGQILVGNYGDNVITGGGAGAGQIDQLAGLRGDDTYEVTSRNTTVNENAAEGTDVVNVNLDGTNDSFFKVIDQAAVEFVNATGTNAIDIEGSSFAQVIAGNIAANTLVGGGGADTLIGAAGADNYLVNSQDVQIVEALGGTDIDTVFTTVSYDLTNTVDYIAAPGGNTVTGQVGVEVLSTASQAGTDAINLVGNSAAQTLIGNFGDNILNGDNDTVTNIGGVDVQTGTVAGDTLTGLFGDDIYRVYSQADVIREQGGQGNDTAVFGFNTALSGTIATDAENTFQLSAGSSIEVLTVANQSRAVGYQLIGNGEAQTVLGSLSDDALWGGAGNDTLIGNGGNDVFGFNEVGSANGDVVTDFARGDRFGLATIANGDGNVAAFSALGTTFESSEFVTGTSAVGTNAQIVYNQDTGQIFYDADGTGSGAAELVATIVAGTQLGFNDFTVLTAPATTPAVG
jgi:Ca2+-binding RTX toxin-like protein